MIYYLQAVCLLLLSVAYIGEASQGRTLKCGWYSWEPYQYIKKQDELEYLTGLDIQILNTIAKVAGYKITYEEISWQQHQTQLKEGLYDIAAGVTKTSGREQYYYFSVPYRESIDSLFTLKTLSKKLKFKTSSEFIAEVKRRQFRLGVIEGYNYKDSELNSFINDDHYQHLVIKVNTTLDNVLNLKENRIDGFLADRINGATIAWRHRLHEEMERHDISRVPIHLILSKKSTSPNDLMTINQAIQKVKKTQEYKAIFKTYLFSPLVMQAIDKRWFYIIDIIGTIAFALSGIIIAYQIQATLFTTLTLALLPAVGGGMMRDIIVGRRPLGVLQTSDYLLAVLLTVFICYTTMQVITYIYTRGHASRKRKGSISGKILGRALDIFDALGLAAFTVIGTNIAVISKCEPLWLWGPLLAAITGAGGGVLRDLLRPDRHITSLTGELYAEVAIIWSLFLSIFLHFNLTYSSPDEVLGAIIITLIGVFITRMIVSIFNIRGPNFLADERN